MRATERNLVVDKGELPYMITVHSSISMEDIYQYFLDYLLVRMIAFSFTGGIIQDDCVCVCVCV